MPGGEGGAIPAALGCKQEEVGACLVCNETGDRFAISLLQHHVCVHSVILQATKWYRSIYSI